MQVIEDHKLKCILGGIQTQNYPPAGMFKRDIWVPHSYLGTSCIALAHILAELILDGP